MLGAASEPTMVAELKLHPQPAEALSLENDCSAAIASPSSVTAKITIPRTRTRARSATPPFRSQMLEAGLCSAATEGDESCQQHTHERCRGVLWRLQFQGCRHPLITEAPATSPRVHFLCTLLLQICMCRHHFHIRLVSMLRGMPPTKGAAVAVPSNIPKRLPPLRFRMCPQKKEGSLGSILGDRTRIANSRQRPSCGLMRQNRALGMRTSSLCANSLTTATVKGKKAMMTLTVVVECSLLNGAPVPSCQSCPSPIVERWL